MWTVCLTMASTLHPSHHIESSNSFLLTVKSSLQTICSKLFAGEPLLPLILTLDLETLSFEIHYKMLEHQLKIINTLVEKVLTEKDRIIMIAFIFWNPTLHIANSILKCNNLLHLSLCPCHCECRKSANG